MAERAQRWRDGVWRRARRRDFVAAADDRRRVVLGYLYYRLSGGGAALAAMGLIAFMGVSQVLPALLGGIFWRGATRIGAAAGVATGLAIWLWTSFLPSFGDDGLLTTSVFQNGPFGIGFLRPQALFNIEGLDPLVHSVFWSILLNVLAFVVGSILSFPNPLERLQGATFVNIYRYSESARGWTGGAVDAEDLLMMAQRIIGSTEAQVLFEVEADKQGKQGYLPDVTPTFLERLERELAGSVGAATAHAMLAQITGGVSVSVEDLMAVADEAQQILEYSSELEAKSQELGRTARQLGEANDKLMALSVQKDGFLSQISHELRTPMTSIRSFSEILMTGETMSPDERLRYSRIIHDETIRLTRLLDDLLDLSVLENGQVTLHEQTVELDAIIERAIAATEVLGRDRALTIKRDGGGKRLSFFTDGDRLAQVFINIIANAQKYCDAEHPSLTIVTRDVAGRPCVDFIDNGSGIPTDAQKVIFEKFARVSDSHAAGGAGLGLAICREVMTRLGGSIVYLPGQGGAAFRVILPDVREAAA